MTRHASLAFSALTVSLVVSAGFADEVARVEPADPAPTGISAATLAEVTEDLQLAAIEEPSATPRDDAADGAVGEDDLLPMDEGDAPESDTGAEGAAGSNPLAAVSKIDLIWQYTKTTTRKHVNDFNSKGSTMLHPRVKLNLELHYWETNVTGDSERDWEQLSIKPIWFVKDVPLNETWGMRIATGAEYIVDFGNEDEGIGTGADQFAPLLGFALMNRDWKTILIPLVQHFEDVESGADIRTTAFRLIALQPLPDGMWTKGDLKTPRDWENETWPASLELEFGKVFTPNVGPFVNGLAGLGGERPFTYGAALGLRINF